MHNKSEISLANAPSDLPGSREKLEGGKKFILNTDFIPAGDQPSAIQELASGILANEQDQVLLGATGTGKRFVLHYQLEYYLFYFLQ